MRQAGIDPANFGYVEYIVSHESGWNPCSFYPSRSNCGLSPNDVNSTSGNPNVKVACGLGMQLPCGKWAGAWNDPIAALVAMNSYVSRYGGWAGAYGYWLAHGNY
jgi:hypothetical protein